MKLISLYKDGELVFEGNCQQASKFIGCADTTIYKRIGSKDHRIGNYEFTYKKVAQSSFDKLMEERNKKDPLKVIIEHLKIYGNTNLMKEELKYIPEIEKQFKINICHYPPTAIRSICQGGDDYQSGEDWIITVEEKYENL